MNDDIKKNEVENDELSDSKFSDSKIDEEKNEENEKNEKNEKNEENEENENNEEDEKKKLEKLSEEELNNLRDKHYLCPKCRSYFVKDKWVRNPGPTLAILKSGMAYCENCLNKIFDDEFIGRIEIHSTKLESTKEDMLEIADRIARTLENSFDFERILSIYEEDGNLIINTNTTDLAKKIGKTIWEEYKGGIEYCWVDKNQFLIVKWFDELDNSNYFKDRLRQKKERFPGSMFFDEDDKKM